MIALGAWLFIAQSKLAVQSMIEEDYGTDDVRLTLSKLGWNKQVHFYVEYRVSFPNKGTFDPSVPRISTVGAWYTSPRCQTGYFSDVFPEYTASTVRQ
jgi:hypothetical protein